MYAFNHFTKVSKFKLAVAQTIKEYIKQVDWSATLSKPIKQSQLSDILSNICLQEKGGYFKSVDTLSTSSPYDNIANIAPLKILIAEDNIVNQKVITNILKRLGYRADVVANGLEVLENLRRQSYDLILMDVQMPEMDGLTATRQIRTLWDTPHGNFQGNSPHIIAMTANAMKGDQEKCLDAGMDDYLSKPINRGKLQELLEHWIRKPIMKKAIDDQALQSLKDSTGEDASIEIINAYLNFLPQSLEKLQAAYENKDLNQLVQLAHIIKSSSAGVGAKKLSEICLELELFKNKEFSSEITDLLSLINEESALVLSELQKKTKKSQAQT